MTIGATTRAAVLAVLLLFSSQLGSAEAAPATQPCNLNVHHQYDMAGVYVSSYHQMRLEAYPCGGTFLQWGNQYGTHYASYVTTGRLPGGGMSAVTLDVTPVGLDGVKVIIYKPAEPGWIEVLSVSPYAEMVGLYRLRKIS